MTHPPRRSLNTLDAMLLVAATAFGAASLKPYDQVRNSVYYSTYLGHYVLQGQIRIVKPNLGQLPLWHLEASHFVAAWTVALLAIQLRGPRPRLRRLARQPGFAATVVATIAIAAMAVWQVSYHFAWARRLDVVGWGITSARAAGYGVAGAWIALVLVGRRRLATTWTDRLGQLFGVFWMSSIPIFLLIGL